MLFLYTKPELEVLEEAKCVSKIMLQNIILDTHFPP